ncbi:MAG TPA: DUF393 domain-containing protein [Cryptosporangiaceae bacterium]|nr:DUF393 domain-containing protein [Cryptosporangiaceae bacterium]
MARPTFVFDGDCAFCSSCARFIERRIPTRAAVVAWQRTDLDALGISAAQCEEAVQWVGTEGDHASGAAAVGRLLVDAGSFWRPLGRALLAPPLSWIGPPVYRLIARHRDKLPGGTKACALPQAERGPDGPGDVR